MSCLFSLYDLTKLIATHFFGEVMLRMTGEPSTFPLLKNKNLEEKGKQKQNRSMKYWVRLLTLSKLSLQVIHVSLVP